MMMSDGSDQTHADKLASRERCAEHVWEGEHTGGGDTPGDSPGDTQG